MNKFFYPKSMVVIGVSTTRLNLGRIILMNNAQNNFKGNLYGIGGTEGEIEGVKVYEDISDIPETPDVAVIITKAATVAGIMESCGEKGIKHIVIESGGFSEYLTEKSSLEDEVMEVAKKYGMRVIGPNCIGLINTEINLMMPFAFFKGDIQTGGMSIISQSGGVGDTYMRLVNENHIFFNKFASTGNKLDIDEVDYLDYFIKDKSTSAILMYLEGFSRGREFFDLAMTSHKPIVVQKSNISEMSASIAQSHTTALSASDDVVTAALSQSGVIRVEDEGELEIAIKALNLPVLKGKRLAVLSRSGGHAVITTDACFKNDFELIDFPDSFIENLKNIYEAKVITHQNPLDLGEIFDYTIFIKILEEALKLDEVDGIIFNHLYQSAYESETSRTFLDGVNDLVKKYNKPVAVTLISDAEEIIDISRNSPYPTFTTPYQSTRALALSYEYYKRIETRDNKGKAEKYPIDLKIIDEIKNQSKGRIPLTDEALEICSAAGIHPIKGNVIKDEADIDKADMEFPVAVKLLSKDASHKSDIGGVELNIKDKDELKNKIAGIKEKIKALKNSPSIDGFLVQTMAASGEEFFVGARKDPVFGPIVMAGFGGIFLEIIKDKSIRLAPVTKNEAHDMLKELKMFPVLQGARGRAPLDVDAVVDVICKLSSLITEVDEITEVDLNPVIVHEKGVSIVDSRVFF